MLTPPDRRPEVDPEKLLAAWVAITEALSAVVAVTAKHERDNEQTRADNARTRAVALVALVVVVLIAAMAAITGTRAFAEIIDHCQAMSAPSEETLP